MESYEIINVFLVMLAMEVAIEIISLVKYKKWHRYKDYLNVLTFNITTLFLNTMAVEEMFTRLRGMSSVLYWLIATVISFSLSFIFMGIIIYMRVSWKNKQEKGYNDSKIKWKVFRITPISRKVLM